MALSKQEARIVRAIGQTIYPRGGAIEADAVDVNVVEYVDDYLDRMPLFQKMQFKALFRALNVGFGVWAGEPRRRFVDGGPDERKDYLNSWETSTIYPQRMVFEGVRVIFTLAYADTAEVGAAFGLNEAPDETESETPVETTEPPTDSAQAAGGGSRGST